jgi:hypothetical protein
LTHRVRRRTGCHSGLRYRNSLWQPVGFWCGHDTTRYHAKWFDKNPYVFLFRYLITGSKYEIWVQNWSWDTSTDSPRGLHCFVWKNFPLFICQYPQEIFGSRRHRCFGINGICRIA